MVEDMSGAVMSKRDIFVDSEGDAWFMRNRSTLEFRSKFLDIDFLAPYVTAVDDG